MADGMVPEWTVETARLDERLKAQATAVDVALANQEKAIIKAEIATEKRFEAVNEFRSTLADQAQRLMPRAEAETRFGTLEEKVGTGQARLDVAQGQGQGSADFRNTRRLDTSLVVAIGGFIVSASIGVIAIAVSIVVAVTR